MSASTLRHPNVIPVRRESAVGRLLILTSLVLLTGTLLVIVFSAAGELNAVDGMPVVRNSVIPIPVPTPPTTVIRPILSETPVPASAVASEPSIVPVPVPTPPSP